MLTPILRATRFGRSWLRPRPAPSEEVIEVEAPARPIRASLYRGALHGTGPAWVLLHGVTRTGLEHPSLVRTARAVARTGATVVVPEIPEWIELRLAPAEARRAVAAVLDHLEGDPQVRGRAGIMGFSFGGPQAIRLASDPSLGPRLACAASFGGYADLDTTLRFQFTGEHEWGGRRFRLRPDPYGRWIAGANYLTRTPGHEDAEDVARALWRLAVRAGDVGTDAWDPAYDPFKEELEAEVAAERRALFRLFAPPSARDPIPDTARVRALAAELAVAGLAADPALALPDHPAPLAPVILIHGRSDHLIPFTETLRLRRRLASPPVDTLVTPLFGHSRGDARPRSPVRWGVEAARFLRTLSRVFGGV